MAQWGEGDDLGVRDSMGRKNLAMDSIYEHMQKLSSDDQNPVPKGRPPQQHEHHVPKHLETVLEVDSEAELSTVLTMGELLARKGLHFKAREEAPLRYKSRSVPHQHRLRSRSEQHHQQQPHGRSTTPKLISNEHAKSRSESEQQYGHFSRSTSESGRSRSSSRSFSQRPWHQRSISAEVEVQHNFQSKYCVACGRQPYFFKRRCLVCGKLYCWKCTKVAMGQMLEGRKCVGCTGHPANKRYLKKKKRNAIARGCAIPLFKHANHKTINRSNSSSISPSATTKTMSFVPKEFYL